MKGEKVLQTLGDIDTNVLDYELGLSGGHQPDNRIITGSTQQFFTKSPFTSFGNQEFQGKSSSEEVRLEQGAHIPGRSPHALKIVRAHFLSKALRALDWIRESHELDEPTCVLQMSVFFQNIIKLYKQNSQDPFSSYAIALYDGLSLHDNWLNIERDVYVKIYNQMISMNERENLSFKDIHKEISRLEEWGIDTTPY